jgi:hypothetical protein
VTVLGVVYVHRKTTDGGDIYVTRDGLPLARHLEVSNWYESEWFRAHREPLEGTSAVYRVATRPVAGKSIDLVVKNCRVGEDVPVETRAILAEIDAEFNSPWEEFALVTELRQGRYGPADLRVRTQLPLAIYVPPVTMQMWQTGRSRHKINRICARHPGIVLDILRQYWLIYRWIEGKDIVQLLDSLGTSSETAAPTLAELTDSVNLDLSAKGYVVADMKPAHVIIDEPKVAQVHAMAGCGSSDKAIERTAELVRTGEYSVVDYELLMRTAPHEEQVKQDRRHRYLDDVRACLVPTELPPHLEQVEILGVPYIYGHVESTGGKLWVVGRNARLFDYFLPERWRKTPSWRLSNRSEIFCTVTKDRINLVWKESRVGERPVLDADPVRAEKAIDCGYNSPFEEFCVAHALGRRGISTVYVRAIYKTGTEKLEASTDRRRYESHGHLFTSDGTPILREDRNYVTLRGFYSGPAAWVAGQTGGLGWPLSVHQAQARGVLDPAEGDRIMQSTREAVAREGYDASLLDGSDVIIGMRASGEPERDVNGRLDVRISNFELIRPMA